MTENKNATRREGPAEQRGIALIGVVGLLLVFLIFAGAMLDQLAYELNSTKMSAVSNRSLAAADAGVRAMTEQIQTNLALNAGLPTPMSYSYPEPGASPSVVSYQATILKQWPAGALNYYLIESTGTFQNGILSSVTRTVRAIVKSHPIADYASFSNYETNQFGNPVWYLSTQHFNGPVYSGGPMNIAYATPAPSPLPTVEPIFLGTVDTVNSPNWSPGNPGAPGSADWLSVISGGATQFTQSATGLSLPQSSSNIAVASEAWEGDSTNAFSSGYPAVPAGVYIDGSASGGQNAANTTDPTDSTGIFINTLGSAATIVATASGNTETMKITSPAWSGTYVVSIDYTDFEGSGNCNGTTSVTFGSASHVFAGTPCGEPGVGVTNPGAGAIFATGNINLGNAGTPNTTIEGSYTVAVPDYQNWPNMGATINIADNLTYYDAGSQLYDELGLWANNVVLTGKNTSDIQIDAAIIAGWPSEPSNNGTFNNANCTKTTCGTLDQGTLTVLGSLAENARGAVGEVVSGSQFGFSRIIDFDSRFSTSPPPFNPTTGELDIVAWEDLGQ